VLAALLLVGALSNGPIRISFAGPYVDQILKDQYPELDLKFSELELAWDNQDKDLVFGLSDVSVRRNESPVAQIPAVTVTFSSDALLTGKIAPSGLEFRGLKVLLARDEEGGVRLGYSYDNEVKAPPKPLEREETTIALIQDLLKQLASGKTEHEFLEYMERLEIYQTGLFIEDRKLDKFWRISSADIVVWRSEYGLTGRVEGNAHIGEGTIELAANIAYYLNNGTAVLNTSITEFPPSLLASEVKGLEILKGVDLPANGDINVALNDKFEPVQVGFKISTGSGKVDIPSLYKKPLTINSASAEGHIAAPFNAVNLNRVTIDTPGPKISMSGSFSDGPDGFGMSIDGSFPELKSNDLGFYWPYSAGKDAYNWVTKKVRDGIVRDTTFRVDLPPGAIKSGKIPDGSIELKFRFEGVSADYFAPLPKVTNISGQSILTEKQIHIFDLKGDLLSMKLPEADVLIYDFDKDDQIADITIKVEGQNKDVFEFLDRKPLELVSSYGIVPAKMKGAGSVDAQFVFPLLDDLKLSQVVYEAKGEFQDGYIPDVYEGIDLSDGDLSVNVTPKQLTVTGPAKLKGNPAQISFQSWFKGDKKGLRRYEVQGQLDQAARQKLDVDTEYLKGPVAASLGVDVHEGGKATGVVTLNLLQAEIDIPELYIKKPLGVRGLLGAQFTADGKGNAEISNIRLSSETVELVAKATTDDFGLKKLTASKLSFGESNVAVTVFREKEKAYRVQISGPVFDLKPYILSSHSLNLGRADEEPSEMDVRVEVNIERALLDAGVTLKDLKGFARSNKGVIEEGKLTARFSKEFGINYELHQTRTGRDLIFTSNHAGLLLKGIDLFDNAREGELKITAKIDDTKEESTAVGEVKIKDFRVVKAPVLGRILTLGSLGGIVELLQNDGMTFSTVEGPFTYQNGVITTKDFRAVGSIGITLNGTIDQKNSKVDAFGTVIPSYTLNSILGNIPILGKLLVGREGEGIFGFSYKVKGSTEKPDISVNPISALAPGILRRMFFEPWGNAGEKTDGDNKPDQYYNKQEER